MDKIRCVYRITCIASGKFYIGSAVNWRIRRRIHLWKLRKGIHPNRKLQNAFSKYGESAFAFEPMLILKPEDDLLAHEQRTIDQTAATIQGFNIASQVGGRSFLGCTHTVETREKLASIRRGKPSYVRTTAHRSGVSLRMKGRVHRADSLEKMSAAKKGKILTLEHRIKLSKAGLGKKLSPIAIAKRTATRKSRPVSEAQRAQISRMTINRMAQLAASVAK